MEMKFGMPSKRPERSSTELKDVPHVKLLAVLVADGGFQRFKTIASALTQADLERYLSQWLMDSGNAKLYLGQYTVTAVPYVGTI